MPIIPCTVVTFIADKGFTGGCDHGSFVTVVRGDDVEGTTLHFPFTHPQLAGTTIDRSLAAHRAHQVTHSLVCLVGTARGMTALGRYTVIICHATLCRSRSGCHHRGRSLGRGYRYDRGIACSAPAYQNKASEEQAGECIPNQKYSRPWFRISCREHDNYLGDFRLWRNGHEPVRSYSTHENGTIYDAPPPQGLSEARRV